MSRKPYIKLDEEGVRELLCSEQMRTIVQELTDRILQNAGGASKGYEAQVKTYSRRIAGKVYAETDEARKDNNENNTLVKALR